jgi:hypothetical protein
MFCSIPVLASFAALRRDEVALPVMFEAAARIASTPRRPELRSASSYSTEGGGWCGILAPLLLPERMVSTLLDAFIGGASLLVAFAIPKRLAARRRKVFHIGGNVVVRNLHCKTYVLVLVGQLSFVGVSSRVLGKSADSFPGTFTSK